MRAAWAAFLLLPLLLVPGCIDHERRTPVVLVAHDVSWTGGQGGAAEAMLGSACELATYSRDPLRVTLASPGEPVRPDLLALHDFGDAWRALPHAGGDGLHPILVAAVGGDPTGPLAWLHADEVSTDGDSVLGTTGPFPRHDGGLPDVAWRHGRAWFGDAALDEGRSVVHELAYDVPTEGGAPLRVTHRMEATYLGRVEVELREQTQSCRTGPVRIGEAAQSFLTS